MIGMALGSPSQPNWPSQDQTVQLPAPSPLGVRDDVVDEWYFDAVPEPLAKKKANKWKAIGGLFRAKNAMANSGANSPFYSLQTQYAAHVSPHESPAEESKPTPPSKTELARQIPLPIPHRTMVGADLTQNGRPVLQKDWEVVKPSIELSRSAKNSEDQALHKYEASYSNSRHFLEYDRNATKPSFLQSDAGPLLNIEIPDIQMERYSVMFGNLLEKPQSSNLLSRRSKVLDKLKTIAIEEEKTRLLQALELPDESHSPSVNLSQDGYLKPRRATSPSFQKSPSFSLFPATPTKVENMVGQLHPDKPSPLQRSYTAPSGPSPRREVFQHPITPLKNGTVMTVSSPAQTTSSTTHGLKSSSDSFFLSPTSSRSSFNGEDFLFDVRPLHPLNEDEDQQWQMVSTEKLVEVGPLRPKHTKVDPVNLPILISLEAGKERQATPPQFKANNVNDDTLAALERPPPKGQDIAPIAATKSRIDQIMSPSPLESLPKVPADERKDILTSSKIPRVESQNLNERSVMLSSGQPHVVVNVNSTNETVDRKAIPAARIVSPAVQAARKRAASRARQPIDSVSEGPTNTSPDSTAIQEARLRAKGLAPVPKIQFNDDGTIVKDDFTESRAVRAAKKQARLLAKKSQETLTIQTSSAAFPLPPELPANKPTKSPVELSIKASNGDSSVGMSPAEVSIARQISVSQRQRQQLLVPVHKTNHMSEDEKIVNRSPSTPMIVEVQRGHRPGKSQDIVIENA